MAADNSPKFRIVEAAERAGVSAATLRAWERRYGIPTPARTRTGYRLYSDNDLQALSRMKNLVENGLAANEAAEQVRAEQRGRRKATLPDAERLKERLLDAACEFDGPTLERVLVEVTRAYSAADAVRVVLHPTMVQMGLRWADGSADIAHEHWLTQRLRAFIASMLANMRARATRGVAIVACFPDEDHDVGCYVLAVHLASLGFRPVVLGAKTPPSALAFAVRDLDPAIVCLSLTNPPTAADKRALTAYRTACRGRPLWLGGSGIAKLGKLPRGVQGAGVSARDLLATLKPAPRAPRKPAGSRSAKTPARARLRAR